MTVSISAASLQAGTGLVSKNPAAITSNSCAEM
jgi:hypothetical protein